MQHEYRTNESHRFLEGAGYPTPNPPIPGDDWRLVSAFPRRLDNSGGFVMVWTWERPKKRAPVECPTEGCLSIARKDGKCLACGAVIPEE